MGDAEAVIYWDTSAVLSVLFEDQHSSLAVEQLTESRIHVVSSLAWAEAHAVMGRLRREGVLSEPLLTAAQDILNHGPWRRISTVPEWNIVRVLASRRPLRGADLWHLAMAKTLQRDLPELSLLSYDVALCEAAIGEGLA